MSRKSKSLVMLCITIGALGIAVLIRAPKSDAVRAKVAMLNVGQGDSILITAPSGAQMLIDGGRDSKVLSELAKVMPTGDHSIDVVIATHPDADHIGGLPLVVDRYKIGLFLTSQVQGDTDVYRDLMSRLIARHVPAYIAYRGEVVALDSTTTFKVLFPDREVTDWETNTASVVGRLDIGKRSALFTGDSPLSIEHHRTD